MYQQVQETRPDDVALQVQDLSESLQQRLQVDREELEEEQSKQSQELQKRVELKKLARTAATDLVFEPTVDITDEDEAASGVFSGISKDDNFHLLPTKWIGSFFDDPLSCDSLDTSSFICTHGCVDVDKVSDLKAVNYDCVSAGDKVQVCPTSNLFLSGNEISQSHWHQERPGDDKTILVQSLC